MLEYLLIGEITKPQGVRGELKLRPSTCDPDRFDGLKVAYLKEGDNYRPVNISVRRIGDDAIFFSMEGIESRNDAEEMRGKMLYIDRAHAVELDEDTNFICDLIGLKGMLTDGTEIGKMTDVLQPGGNDVYVFDNHGKEVLVPALKIVVEKVDVREGFILLNADRMAEVAVYEDED